MGMCPVGPGWNPLAFIIVVVGGAIMLEMAWAPLVLPFIVVVVVVVDM